jgi:hypothetical protein
MNLTKLLAVAVTAILFAASAAAQTNPVDAATEPTRDGKVIVPERPTATDSTSPTVSILRPPRLERESLPAAVASPVERFKREARAYIEREEALKKKLEGANDTDRAAIRERIKTLREQWSERARELRKEFKERRDELADKMPDRQELFNSIRDNAQRTLQDGGDRPRYEP